MCVKAQRTKIEPSIFFSINRNVPEHFQVKGFIKLYTSSEVALAKGVHECCPISAMPCLTAFMVEMMLVDNVSFSNH